MLVQISYAIGVAKPLSIFVNTYGTSKVGKSDGEIAAVINECFDLRPAVIIEKFGLKNPIYSAAAAYGHFGRDEPDFSWERTDKVEQLRADAGL